METVDLRKNVMAYINTADHRLLKLIKALAESYVEGSNDETVLTHENYQEIDRRREAHLMGESKSFTWEEVQQNARDSVK